MKLFHCLILITFYVQFSGGEKPFRQLPQWKESEKENSPGFYIYCYEGSQEWQSLKFLSSVTVEFRPIDPDETLLLYIGSNHSAVEAAKESAGIFRQLQYFSPWAATRQRLSPFKRTCVGIETEKGFEVVANQRAVDLLYICLLYVGLVLYLIAPSLSRNYVFHYSSGIAIGVLASLLVLVYVVSKFIPKKTGAVSVLVGGWALVGFFLRWIVENFLTIQYKAYILGYVILAAVVSFCVCYRYGPVTDKRTENLLQWGLQLIALMCIYNSSHLEGVSVAIIMILIVYSWVPIGTMEALKNFSIWKPKPEIKLLSADEFEDQGREETRRALEELREYCRSPKCNAWKAVTRLDSPKRFAEFVSGDSHVSQDELDLYTSDMSIMSEDLLTSDSSDSEELDEDATAQTPEASHYSLKTPPS